MIVVIDMYASRQSMKGQAQAWLQVCGGGDRCRDQGDQGPAEGRCGVRSAAGTR